MAATYTSLVSRPLPISQCLKLEVVWGQGYTYTTTLLGCMYNVDLQQYVCETSVGIQVSDSFHPTALQCTVYKSHTSFQSVFSNISKLYDYFFVAGDFPRSPIFTVFMIDLLSIKIK